MKGPRFNVGDIVCVRVPGRSPVFCTVLEAPKTSRGKRYLVSNDGKLPLGRGPQVLPEYWLRPTYDINDVGTGRAAAAYQAWKEPK